jgi:hypothetical protein
MGVGGNATLTKTNYITLTPVFTQNWRLITTTVSPPINGEHAMAYDSARNRVVLYGGNGTGWPYSNATWEFDGTNWLTITTAVSPTARYGAAMAYDNVRGVMILFGGSNADDLALNQTWRYTNSTWSQVTITGTVPPSRIYASMATGPNGVLYLFGGNDGITYFRDFWKYDNGTWYALPDAPASYRTRTGMAYDLATNSLVVFAGYDHVVEVWPPPNFVKIFDLNTATWSVPTPSGNYPSIRMAHSFTYNPATGSIVLVGGTTFGSDTLLGDTWHWTAQNGWTQAYPTTPLPPRAYHQTVYGNNALILFSNGEVWKYE